MKKMEMKEIQHISIEILKQIADICEAQHLRYYLFYGTLIGAVRHHGFIPWDDDLDIMMPRQDHDMLLKYLKEHQKDYPNLRIFNPQECPQYPYMITRISDDRYRIVMDNEKEYGMGIFIDVYPFDGLGNTKEEALHFGNIGDRLSSLCFQSTRKHVDLRMTRSLNTSVFYKIIKLPVWCVSRLIGKNFFQKKLATLAYQKPYDASKFVGCIVWLSGGVKDIFKREWFDESVLVPYEQYSFRIPKAYDQVLRHTYGDYMQLPPENERIGHHFYYVYKK